MTATIRVTLVPSDDGDLMRYEEISIPTYDGIRALLNGGWLELIGGEGWCAYLDEEGKIKGLDVNDRATRLARALGWQGMAHDVLCGPVVFVGPSDEDGNDTAVPDKVRKVAVAIGVCG